MPKTEFPLVSVAIITYNSAKFVSNAINSALSQDYPNIEIVISDDASTDNTLEVLNKFTIQYPDKIRVLVAKKNLGAVGNHFKCISACKGKYVSWLAGDDEFLPGFLSKQAAAMETDPDIAICYTDAAVFDVPTQKTLYKLNDKMRPRSGSIEVALRDSIYHSVAIMMRRDLTPPENTFKGFRYGADIPLLKELMIRSAPNGKLHYIPEVLYKYQKHGTNITQTDGNYRKEHVEAIKLLQGKYPAYRTLLNPAIYDFCCVGFLKSALRLKARQALYFLSEGMKAAGYNPFRFFRVTQHGLRFYLKKAPQN